MVMVIPSPFGVRDGTAVPDRSDGRSRLLVATRANHPNSETGRAAVKVPLVGSVDDVLHRHETPSQTEPASTPEAIWDQQSSGGPSEKYQCTGIGRREGGVELRTDPHPKGTVTGPGIGR